MEVLRRLERNLRIGYRCSVRRRRQRTASKQGVTQLPTRAGTPIQESTRQRRKFAVEQGGETIPPRTRRLQEFRQERRTIGAYRNKHGIPRIRVFALAAIRLRCRLPRDVEQQPHHARQQREESTAIRHLRRIGRRLPQDVQIFGLAPTMPLFGSAYYGRLRRI